MITNNILYESNEGFNKPNSKNKRQDMITNNNLYESRSNFQSNNAPEKEQDFKGF